MTIAEDSTAERLIPVKETAEDAGINNQPMESSISRHNKLFCPGSNRLTALGHGLLTGCLLLGTLVINVGMFSFAIKQESNWLNYDNLAKDRETSESAVASVQATEAERTRMVDQLILVQARMKTHAKVMGLFYTLNFVSLGTIVLMAGVASVSLFFISKAGWEQINNAVINVFVISAGLIIFHSNFILIFKFQDNIKLNGQLYSEYNRLYNSILSYWAIQPSTPEMILPAEFILSTDQQLADLGKISLEFDVDRISELRQPLKVFEGQEN